MSSLQNWLSAGSLTSGSARFSRSGCVRIRWSSACTTTSEARNNRYQKEEGSTGSVSNQKLDLPGAWTSPSGTTGWGAGLVRNEREARKDQSVTFSLELGRDFARADAMRMKRPSSQH